MAAALWGGMRAMGDWFAVGPLMSVTYLTALVGGGAAVYFVACHAVGLRASHFRIKTAA
jgi:hypothetical protein